MAEPDSWSTSSDLSADWPISEDCRKLFGCRGSNTPRTLVPGGSVGMAGGQANAISTDQPSGFNYIGRTFVSLYDPRNFPPIPFIAGDEVEFIPVSVEEALRAQGRQATDFL